MEGRTCDVLLKQDSQVVSCDGLVTLVCGNGWVVRDRTYLPCKNLTLGCEEFDDESSLPLAFLKDLLH